MADKQQVLAEQLNTQLVAMRALLEAENAALRARDLDAILQTSEQKNQALLALSALEQDISTTLGEVPANLAQTLADVCHDPRLAQSLRQLSSDIQQLNQRNGALIQSMIRFNENALALLTGQEKEAPLYGASGQSKPAARSSNPNKLASA